MRAQTGWRFYGWWGIVLPAFLIIWTTNGLTLNGVAVFDEKVLGELGVSVGALKFRELIQLGTAAIVAPLIGWLADRHGVRPFMVFGAVVLAVALYLYSSIDSIGDVYWIHFLMGTTLACCGLVLCVVIVSRWFVDRRGLALGLMLAGTSLGNSLYPGLNTWLIESYGWRPAFAYISAIPLLLVPLILLAIKEWPQRLGLQAYSSAQPATASAQATSASIENRALSYGDILRSPNFWFLGLAAFFTFYSILGLSSNLFLHARQLDYSPPEAAKLFLPLFLLGIVGKVGFGWFADRAGVKLAWAVSLGLMLAGALLLATLERELVLAGVSLFGLGWGGNYSLLQLLTADVFGARSIGKAMGAINVLDAGGGALGPFVTGVLYDVSGNYQLGFGVIVALVALAMVMLVLVRLPHKA